MRVPKIIKVDRHLTSFDKNNFAQFFGTWCRLAHYNVWPL